MASFIDSLNTYCVRESSVCSRYSAAGLKDALTRKTSAILKSEESKDCNKEQREDAVMWT